MVIQRSFLLIVIIISISFCAIKTRSYNIVTTNDFGDTLSIESLPFLSVTSGGSNWEIQFYNREVIFQADSNNVVFDSILIRNEETKEIFQVYKDMLIDVYLKSEFSKALHCNHLDAYLINDSARCNLIPFLKKARRVKVVYYTERVTPSEKPTLIEYDLKGFGAQIEKHLKASSDTLNFISSLTPHGGESYDPMRKGGSSQSITAILTGPVGLKEEKRVTDSGQGANSNNIISLKQSKEIMSTGLSGNRSKPNIMRTIRNNIASFNYAYRRHLKAKPNAKGRVTIKWAIDEFGNVIHCKVVKTTMNDQDFESILVKKIKHWAFGKIPYPGDVTEITYPFVFQE